MSELSGFWTTSGAPAGHQQVSYTQAQWSIAATILAACAGYEGVAGNYLNSLVGTYISANHVHIDTGAALVDGKWYINDSVAGVTIPNAAPGTIRLDRIVLRCSWVDFHVELTVLTGTAVALPSITQTSGTTYDILLYQASVTDAGVVTLTDERTVSRVNTNGIETSAVTLAKMAANSVDSDQYVDGSIDLIHMSANSVDSDQYVDGSIDNVHLALGASKITYRQGGDASSWVQAGTTTYSPSTVVIQCGAFATTGAVSTITFPAAFSNIPIGFISVYAYDHTAYVSSITATTMEITHAAGHTITIHWMAIGPA